MSELLVLPIFPLPDVTFFPHTFLPDPSLRQSLLETLDVGERLRRVAQALDDVADDLKGR